MRRRLPWPWPAVLSWTLCWLAFKLALGTGLGLPGSLALGTGLGVLASLVGDRWWRRLWIAAGFPLALALSSHAALPAWVWLIPLALLLLVYPLNAWRDAPLFPTPAQALAALAQHAPLAADARVLDAGCGLGHGLAALHLAYPQAQLSGVEWSWPLRALCALRCPWARVRQGDMWQADWSGYDLVYVFQRPESMGRVVDKARRELRPGSYLVSLEFAADSVQTSAHYRAPGGKMVWIYRAPLRAPAGE